MLLYPQLCHHFGTKLLALSPNPKIDWHQPADANNPQQVPTPSSCWAPSTPHTAPIYPRASIPAAGLYHPKPSCHPGGSSGCSRRRIKPGDRGRRGAAKALPCCVCPERCHACGESCPAVRWLLCVWHCAVLVPIYAAVSPSQGEEKEKEGGLLSFSFLPPLVFFPKLHPSESVIEVIQC